jgi:homoserine O-acetyltransferase
VQGLGLSLALVTLDARHPGWADKTFGRKWAAEGKDPLASFDNKFAIADTLEKTGLARARTADANSFLYLVRANQLFSAGHKGSLEEGLKGIKAKTLLLPAASDLLLFPAMSERAMRILKLQGTPVDYQEIPGDGGHLDGVLAVAKVGETIRKFLSE